MLASLAAALIAAGAGAMPEETFHWGTLDFHPCELTRPHSAATTAAWCAPFRVPENWDAPDGRKIDLKLAVIRSDAGTPASDAVVFLAGGPGQAATETYPQVAGALAPLRRQRHLLLLDQRGTGGSNKLECEQAPRTDETGVVDPLRRLDALATKKLVDDCVASLKDRADPRYYTTGDAAKDLEAVRQALGGIQYDLVGISYGTRMAQQYLKRYPTAVRSMVLDSVVPNELVLGPGLSHNLDDALKGRFALCEKDAKCKEKFGAVYQKMYAVRGRLQREPQVVTVRGMRSYEPVAHRLNASSFDLVMRMYAYSAETAALLPLLVSKVDAGDAAPLLAQADAMAEQLEAGITAGMALSVQCAEDADLAEPDPTEADLILGDTLVAEMKAGCAAWPRGKRADDFHVALKTDVPVLTLSGEFDPITPPRYAETVAKGSSRGRHLMSPGQGHAVIGRGCNAKLVREFVEKLDAAAIDAGCLADMGATPFFLDYNGAGP